MVATEVNEHLLAGLTETARWVAGEPAGNAVVLSGRRDGVVVRVADVVVKAHPQDTDSDQLFARLRLALSEPLDGVLMRPRPFPDGNMAVRLGDRLATAWWAGEPVSPDNPDAAPWEEAGELLARLHTIEVSGLGPLPPSGAPARVARAVTRMSRYADEHPAAVDVHAALSTLPGWTRGDGQSPPGRPRSLTHGDWHLGQLVRIPDSGWLLLDVDDLGYDDPAWDLARPAAWYATGLLAPEAWARLLNSYRAAGGVAVPADRDPWPVLDVFARALVVQTAALAVASASRQRRELDEVEQAIVDTCRRITSQPRAADVHSS